MLVHGRLGRFRDRWQITHPDLLDPAKGSAPLPLYRLTEGLTQGRLRPVIKAALDRLPALPEWLGSDLVGARRWPAWTEALRLAHAPATAAELEPDAPARQRLAYDELLAGQLALALVRQRRTGAPGRSLEGRRLAADAACSPPCPTRRPPARSARPGRSGATWRRRPDDAAAAGRRRQRQDARGAASPCSQAVEAGCQAALMAPTEVLARQHAATLAKLLLPLGLDVELLTGSEPAAAAAPRAGADRGRAGARRRRHARAVPAERHLPRPRARGRRRAAPLRRGSSVWRSRRRARRPTSC